MSANPLPLSTVQDGIQETAGNESLFLPATRDQLNATQRHNAREVRFKSSFDVISPEDLRRLKPSEVESEYEFALLQGIFDNGSERHLHIPQQRVWHGLNTLLTQFPNFRDVTLEIIGRYRIALLGGHPFTLPVINLQGPPGIGKTTYVRAVAAALGQPFHDIKVSQMMERFELAGMSRGWRNAAVGQIAKMLLVDEPHEGQPVLLFDELCMAKDTADHSVIHPLYTLFDRDSREYFRDLFLDVPINTSFVLAFSATNNIERLRPALRSRLASFEIDAPSNGEMRILAQNIYSQLLRELNMADRFPDLLTHQVLQRLTSGSIRDMKMHLERAITRAVAEAPEHTCFRLSPDHIPEVEVKKRAIGFM
ncbi:AAA family ATPase [Marinobacter sp. F4216]|uniref:AAA family ATPase n=1 Tax=Marinobacter sp. F4216 TaxID=2874281 RepID=UPI001CBAC540|nr:AAA family ATPase [Marinobacter sp. F4216]MBZ2170270.1 AAA family ATPase [Marinobacter sp. F4216]